MKIHRQPLDNCVYAPAEFCCPCFMYLHIWMLENLKHRITLDHAAFIILFFKNKLSFHNYKEYFFYIVSTSNEPFIVISFCFLVHFPHKENLPHIVFSLYICVYMCMCMYMYTYIAFKKIYLLIYFAAPGLRCSMSTWAPPPHPLHPLPPLEVRSMYGSSIHTLFSISAFILTCPLYVTTAT